MIKLTFELTRPARKLGGDRYEHYLDGNKNDKVVVYVPQSISRSGKESIATGRKSIAKEIEITFNPK